MTNMASKLTPLFDRIVVEVVTRPPTTPSGLALPESVVKAPQNTGLVVATGPGRRHDGELLPMTVKVGDTVLFSPVSTIPFKAGDKDYLIFDESSVLAILGD